ncbi:hypothetical protein EWM64_g5250 [Hericium alpestre]|uniref:Uncharacterized protein n=1 Tax=Hericium alpestre TaxID=135208 RepID=A0A4Y9ZZ34_9AGAM|nr:hypothetical protein EWM64_g5250 [Hericium alpestre]
MAVAGKIYKEYNTPERLGQLTEARLTSLGVSEKEDRKVMLAAVSRAGYREQAIERAKEQERKKRKPKGQAADAPAAAKAGEPSKIPLAPPSRKKRKKDETKNDLLPDRPEEEGPEVDSLDFDELLKDKFVIVNRAPVMMAWSFVVAERLGFGRDEALSIASVYTEMNAVSKGVSLGIYDKGKDKNIEATGAQPYVDVMGRRIPLYQTAHGRWRALASSKPAPPAAAHSYITRTLRQTTPAVIGAMRLLADSYEGSGELNRVGWALYADFRPEVNGWGAKGEVRCQKILEMRKMRQTVQDDSGKKKVGAEAVVKYEDVAEAHADETVEKPPDGKKRKLVDRIDEIETLEDAGFWDFDDEDLKALP